MARYFIKFSYPGFRFSGFQRGNGENSIEDSILKCLQKFGISDDIRPAARTDRGVSALGNVFSLDTEEGIEKTMGILNSGVRDCIFHSYSIVENQANPRHNLMKHYRYFLPDVIADHRFQDLLMKFRGQHDFSGFCRKDHRNPVRTIDDINMEWKDGYGWIDFYGKSFIWNQLRSIVGYTIKHYNENNIEPFSTEGGNSHIAPAENLVLMDITYDGIEFRRIRNASRERHLSRERDLYFAQFHAMDTISRYLMKI